jgi:sec-independent protein translocase protein TatB
MLSIPHMIVVFIIVLVVFGPQKLPELARGLGKLMAEFRKASTDFKSAFEEEMRDLERQAREVERKKAALLASSAAQAQPATLASPSGAETQPAGAALAATDDGTRATEAGTLTAVPVAESVARSTEPVEAASSSEAQTIPETSQVKIEPPTVTNSLDSAHDHQQPA